MKLLYVSSSILPSRAANSVHVMKMCDEFSNLVGGEKDVCLIAQKGNGAEDIYEIYGTSRNFVIKKIGLWSKIPKKVNSVIYSLRILIYALRKRPSCIYSRNLNVGIVLVLLGFKVVLEAHAPYIKGIKGSVLKRVVRKVNLLKFVVISSALSDIYKNAGFDSKKVFVAHDGAVIKDPGNIMSRKTKNVNVGYTGHLYQGRGVEVIIALAKLHTDCNFHIVGGNDDDIEYWMNRTSGIDNLKFHGFVSPSDVPNFLNGFDILLAPYQKTVSVAGGGNTVDWMSPLKIFEYMASSKAIIASNLPVLREVLRSGENSLLCEVDSIESWDSALTFLTENPDFRKMIGVNARIEVIEKYSWEARAKKLFSFMEIHES